MTLIAALALIVLGPDKLPDLARTMGRWVRELRAMSLNLRDEIRVGMSEDARRAPSAPAAPPQSRSDAPGAVRPTLDRPLDGFGGAVRRQPDPDAGDGPRD
jgi:sec-independent protein translocase protein TatB